MSITENLHNKTAVTLKETVYDGISYMCPSWEDMGKLNFELAKKIIEARKTSPPFDRLVALARGGWTWGRALADSLEIPELSSSRIRTYTGVNSHREPEIVQPLTDAIDGETILLFDEVIDKGITVKKAVEYLKVMGAKEIVIAALCSKPTTEIKPDFFAFSTTSWVVFPHEIREFIEEASLKWSENHLTINEIHERLTTIGIPEDQAAFFLRHFYQNRLNHTRS